MSRPSDALEARAAAKTAFTSLFLGLGAVALLVGGVGIANVMVISVLERRSEVGLRRALGATRRHVGAQFACESLLLAAAGGRARASRSGALVTPGYAESRGWTTVVPPAALAGGLAAAVLIGAVAGVLPGAAGGAVVADGCAAGGVRLGAGVRQLRALRGVRVDAIRPRRRRRSANARPSATSAVSYRRRRQACDPRSLRRPRRLPSPRPIPLPSHAAVDRAPAPYGTDCAIATARVARDIPLDPEQHPVGPLHQQRVPGEPLLLEARAAVAARTRTRARRR